MSGTAAQILRSINQHLRQGLVRLQAGCNRPAAVTPDYLAGVRAQLLRAPECWREIASGPAADGELRQEITEYCSHLTQLRQVLLLLQGRLQAEKTRLQRATARTSAAEAWAQASKETL